MKGNDVFKVDEIEAESYDENGKKDEIWKGFSVVKDGDEANYCFDCRDKLNAEQLCEFLNTECIVDNDSATDAFVIDNCIEWYNIIGELSHKEEKYYLKKAEYDRKEFDIVYVQDIDYKKLYGSTAEKVRKQHAKTVLKELDKEVKGLELSIDYLKRRLTYLKGLVTVKTALIDVKKGD